jgi:hypothetical protein
MQGNATGWAGSGARAARTPASMPESDAATAAGRSRCRRSKHRDTGSAREARVGGVCDGCNFFPFYREEDETGVTEAGVRDGTGTEARERG